MTNHKKLGLLLLPLVPLTAIGIVEVASAVVVPDRETTEETAVAPVAKPPTVVAPTTPAPPPRPPTPPAPPHPAPSR